MDRNADPKKKIGGEVAATLSRDGAPLPSMGQLSTGTSAYRQLTRYYFDDPTDMLLCVCDCLAEAYRMALVNGVNGLEGQARLNFILDFYFDLIKAVPKPRDDRAHDAMMAYAAGAPNVRDALRDQYTLLGQVLALEIKIVDAHLTLEDCAEESYLFICLTYGHWKMVASPGLAEDHKLITRRAVDLIITLYAEAAPRPKDWPRPWTRQDCFSPRKNCDARACVDGGQLRH